MPLSPALSAHANRETALRWALTGGITGARYFTSQRDQVNFTLGITWSPSERLDVAVLALGSALRGGDRWGMFFALSPKLQLW